MNPISPRGLDLNSRKKISFDIVATHICPWQIGRPLLSSVAFAIRASGLAKCHRHFSPCGLKGGKAKTLAFRSSHLDIFTKEKAHIWRRGLFLWWSNGDSNPGPPACKAGALANWAIAPYLIILDWWSLEALGYQTPCYFGGRWGTRTSDLVIISDAL